MGEKLNRIVIQINDFFPFQRRTHFDGTIVTTDKLIYLVLVYHNDCHFFPSFLHEHKSLPSL